MAARGLRRPEAPLESHGDHRVAMALSTLCASTGGQPLTSGSVGIEAAFVLSADYDGLAVTAVFRTGDVSVDVLLTGPSCTVPWEVLMPAVPG